MASVTLIGFAGLKTKLEKLDKKVRKKIQSKALKEVMKEVVQPAVLDRVPIDTGRLKNAMSASQGIIVKAKAKEAKRGNVGWKMQTPKREKLGLNNDTDFYYPAWLEYKKKSFLRAGLFAVKRQAIKRAQAKIAILVRQEARKKA